MKDLNITALNVYDVDPLNNTVLLKGSFRRAALMPGKSYRLFQRYIDFTIDKTISTMRRVDQRGEESIFVVSTRMVVY
jgi:hypothetical protein